MEQKKSRIQSAYNYLTGFFTDGEQFYVCIPFDEYLECKDLDKYKLPKQFVEGKPFLPAPVGPNTKYNVNGKLIRKQPEEKITEKVHIKYVRKDGTKVEFDRKFHKYVKVIQHHFRVPFMFQINIHKEKFVITPISVVSNDYQTNLYNTHTINIFLEIFSTYEVLTSNLELPLKFTRKYDFELLPKGNFDNEQIDHIVDIFDKFNNDPKERVALHKRLTIISDLKPTGGIEKGKNGFKGYIAFKFPEKGIAIIESMYKDQATYIFDIENCDELIQMDKQTILNQKLQKDWIFHHENWEEKIKNWLK
ncbi:MAG: hypothetical protein V4520_02075 [Bacteroidota bacterium]